MGTGPNGEDIYSPLNKLVPMLNPDDIEIDGWDISSVNLAEAVERARVLEPSVQQQVRQYLLKIKPRPSIYDPDFIASNQVR